MVRRCCLMVIPTLLLTGCMRPQPMMPQGRPAPAPQLQVLAPLVGNWSGSAELVEPDPEVLRSMLPEAERANFKSTFAGGTKTEWALGGTVLRSEGWYEMPDNQKGNYVEYWAWDAREEKFRTWFASDWHEMGTGDIRVSPDGRCFFMKGKGIDAQGHEKRVKGCMCVVDDNTLDWNFTERGPMGKFSMRGTSKRQ